MKFRIHYNGRYEDSFVVEADTLGEVRVISLRERDKRGWEPEKCWSERLEGGYRE